MKEIFLYPGLLAFAAILAGELERLARASTLQPLWRAVVACCVALVVGDVLDVTLLIRDLALQLA